MLKEISRKKMHFPVGFICDSNINFLLLIERRHHDVIYGGHHDVIYGGHHDVNIFQNIK